MMFWDKTESLSFKFQAKTKLLMFFFSFTKCDWREVSFLLSSHCTSQMVGMFLVELVSLRTAAKEQL